MVKNDEFTYFEMVYYGLDRSDRKRHSTYNKGTEKKADMEIKICPKCDKVYEVYGIGQRKYNQFNYENFPRYGKRKEKCASCRVLDGEKTFIAWHRGSSTRIPVSRFRPGYKKGDVRNKEKDE
jgi:hypothetical protein